MSRDEILNMPAGREMDALIAEKVMGLCYHEWKLVPNQDDDDYGVCNSCQKCSMDFWGLFPPIYGDRYGGRYGSFSTDISAAWEVVEKLRKLYDVVIDLDDELASCKILKKVNDEWNREMIVEQIFESIPYAICRAALLAVMENEK